MTNNKGYTITRNIIITNEEIGYTSIKYDRVDLDRDYMRFYINDILIMESIRSNKLESFSSHISHYSKEIKHDMILTRKYRRV